jgi:hypothetical protein
MSRAGSQTTINPTRSSITKLKVHIQVQGPYPSARLISKLEVHIIDGNAAAALSSSGHIDADIRVR